MNPRKRLQWKIKARASRLPTTPEKAETTQTQEVAKTVTPALTVETTPQTATTVSSPRTETAPTETPSTVPVTLDASPASTSKKVTPKKRKVGRTVKKNTKTKIQ